MNTRYYIERREKENNYIKHCPKCNSSRVIISRHGIKCDKCGYINYTSIRLNE